MLRRLLNLFRGGPRSVDQVLPYPDGKRIYREFHKLRKEQMDPDALKVINRLSRHGYRSYLVGGCVRDMLLGKRPKDFDVVTQATPSQIRRIFANSRTIGRRFKIVHVVFRGGKVVEVSTFRGLPEHRLSAKKTKDQDYLLKKDNSFGTPKEDAARRDFSINALYFDPRNESIIDYVGGFDDIMNRNLRVIGDPDVSFSEDPVRMFRAAKFAALLGFSIEPESAKAIRRKRDEIMKSSSARLLEEYYKIFRTGKTFEIFKSMAETGLLQSLFPETGKMDGEEFKNSSLGKTLDIADKILTEREDLTTVIYLALLLSDLVADIFTGAAKHNIAEYVKNGINGACQRLNIPGKERDRLMQIFISQPRFLKTERGRGTRPEIFRDKIFFYEAFIVFKIHAMARGDDDAIQKAMFWEFGPKIRPPEQSQIITMFPQRRFRHDRHEGDDDHRRRDHSDRGRDRGRDRGDRGGERNDRGDRSERNDRNERADRIRHDRNRDRNDRNAPDRRPPRDDRPPREIPEGAEAEGVTETEQAPRTNPDGSPRTERTGRNRRRRRFRGRRGGNGGGNNAGNAAGDAGTQGQGDGPPAADHGPDPRRTEGAAD
ncbi:MAG: polynucleotide adenylyltransferase PcnB [Leptospirales bacterium]|nr:polynucleotide adenylyltransferase PcnB [Leptospirales bacterium]